MTRRIVDTRDVAKEIREKFYASNVKREIRLHCNWPTEVLYIGKGLSVMYQSDKWGGPNQPWKHVAEGSQDVYLTREAMQLYDEDGHIYKFGDEWVEVNGDMPQHIAVLAPSLGLQVKLVDGERVEIAIPGTYWGATKHPDTRETYLVLYDTSSIYCLITGDSLDVLKDGIVG